MPKRFQPSEAAIAAARRLYDEGGSFTDIAVVLGGSVSSARKYAKIWGWPVRVKPTSDEAAHSAADKANTDTRGLARRVEAAVRSELGSIERRLGSSSATSAERKARILSLLVKSLAELRKLDREDAEARKVHSHTQGEDDAQRKPARDTLAADLARLRTELAEDLERIHADANGAGSRAKNDRRAD